MADRRNPVHKMHKGLQTKEKGTHGKMKKGMEDCGQMGTDGIPMGKRT